MDQSVIALDVGEKRIGVAIAKLAMGLPTPLTTLQNDSSFPEKLHGILDKNNVGIIVVGLPRNLSGEDTPQTRFTQDFIDRLKTDIQIPIHGIDEAGTSVQAKHELGASKKPFVKGDIDALAATYILEDFLTTRQQAERQQ